MAFQKTIWRNTWVRFEMSNVNGKNRITLILTLFLSVIGLDQITKVMARDWLGNQTFGYLGNLFVLEHAENPGAFLSLGSQLGETARFLIFTVAISLFLVGCLVVLLRKTDMMKWHTIALTLLVAGGASNLIDRIAKGTVTDFMNMGIGGLRTGVFNIADMAIVAGVILYSLTPSKSQP